ncbi:hypothetical protein KR009_005049 [Drosophila setifemur]|nr:hypothetical protein KR009_005049 [Drosophila setifemur]
MKPVTFVLCLLVLAAHSLVVFAVDCEIGGQKLNTGDTYKPPDRCLQYTCQGPKKITAVNCPSVATLKPCKLESDVTKPYPACCPKFNC